MAEMTSKRREFIPKKPLEEVLSRLRSRSPNIFGHSQPQNSVVSNKVKRKGKQIRQDVCDLDFKNKRSGRILSRMTRNKYQNQGKLVLTICWQPIHIFFTVL
jgi:hypothetical protein